MPPLRAGQFLTMRGKIKDRDDLSVPLAVALWAKVSMEMNDKLEAQKAAGAPFRLALGDAECRAKRTGGAFGGQAR